MVVKVSNDVKVVIVATFSIVALAWVLTHASQAGQVTGSVASGYATAVKAILPGQ